MKPKLLILLALFVFACKPAKVKTERQDFEDVEEEKREQVDAVNQVKTDRKSTIQVEGKTYFVAIPNKTADCNEKREMTVEDSQGNKTTTTLNPSDLLIWGSEKVSKEEYEEIKQELNTYKQENKSLKKALITEQSRKETKQNSFFDKLGKWFILVVIISIIIYLFKKLWNK